MCHLNEVWWSVGYFLFFFFFWLKQCNRNKQFFGKKKYWIKRIDFLIRCVNVRCQKELMCQLYEEIDWFIIEFLIIWLIGMWWTDGVFFLVIIIVPLFWLLLLTGYTGFFLTIAYCFKYDFPSFKILHCFDRASLRFFFVVRINGKPPFNKSLR